MNPKRKRRHKEGLLTVGEIAGEVGILSSQVRYYTRMGLLKEASRTQGRYRLYKKAETINRLKTILRLKKEGLSLGQIQKKMGKDPAAFPQEAVGIFKNQPVEFAYLFGSFAKGRTTSLSDIDIAVFLDEKLSENERFELRLKLISQMIAALRTDRVDLIVLNDSPLLLAFNTIRDGVVIYSKDEHKRIKFETKIMSRYFDQQYYYKRHAEATINRIAERGLL